MDLSAIDDSWMQALHLAFLQHWQFGRDIVFSYGPWGFLHGGYHPATYLITMILWSVLSGVFWWPAWRIAQHFFRNQFASWLWLMGFIATADLALVWVLLLLLLHFFVEDRPFTIIQAVLTLSLGLLSLVKFVTFLFAVTVVLLIALDNVLRQRRFPWILPVFIAGLLCFWIAAGQHLSSFVPYVQCSWQITNGFTEAMMLTGFKEVQDLCFFLAAVAVLSVMAAYAAWLRHRFFGIIPLLGLGFILFVTFKYGYVRTDVHEVAATEDLVLISFACLATLWPTLWKKGTWAIIAGLLPTAAIFLFLSFIYSRDAQAGLLANTLKNPGFQGIFAQVEAVRGGKDLREAYEKHLADLRNQFPLPPIEGNIDAYPLNLDPIFAYGLVYHPRPVIQSYSAYTPELAKLNADFLRGENAPKNILVEGSSSKWDFSPQDQWFTIDNRFPSLDDGLSWPELLTRYDVQEAEVSFVLLKQSPQPRQFHLVPLADLAVNFGERIAVPSATHGPIWAEIELDQTLWGKVVSTLYKPPILLLDVSTRGEPRPFRKRLVPGMARSGFLLSPLVEGCTSFAMLAATDASSNLADDEVTSFKIFTADGSSAGTYYHEPVRLRLYRLEYPKQDLEDITGFRQSTQLEKILRHLRLLHADVMPQMVFAPGEGTVLEVTPGSQFLVSVPKGATQLKIGFGIRGKGMSGPRDAGEIVFRVLAVDRQRQRHLLWSRQLDPAAQETDREKQEAQVELGGPGTSGIVLQTLPAAKDGGTGTRSYWSEIDFQ